MKLVIAMVFSLTSGNYNTAIGNTSGNYNTAVGKNTSFKKTAKKRKRK